MGTCGDSTSLPHGDAGSSGSQRLQPRHDAGSASQIGAPAAAGPSWQHGADAAASQAAEDMNDEVRQRCQQG